MNIKHSQRTIGRPSPFRDGRLVRVRNLAIIVAAILSLAPLGGAAAELRLDDPAAAVDSYVDAERVAQRIPGLALLVVKDGKVVKSQGYGLANVEHDAPVTSETIFQSGSVGKQFTAAGVMLLVEDGKLELDDPVAKHIKGTPDAWQTMTVRHLLSHTSGLGGYAPTFDLKRDYTEDALLEALYAGKLAFQPGESWKYSNLGYVTLGILIHKVTGQHYGDFLTKRIFRPLGMTSTQIINEAQIIPRRAAGYRLVDGELKNQEWVSPTMNSTADGSLYFNLVDLAKWDAALRDERLLKRTSLETMWTPATLANGQPNKAGYGFGWFYKSTSNHRSVEHGGAWQGFTTFIARWLDDGLTVVVLTNLSARDSNPGKIARQVAGLYVPALSTTPEPARQP
jgi:CubicO group peptidase (beta-lactamase class C family)